MGRRSTRSVTGEELLAFINNEETVRPDGKRGPGLFRYLRTLTSSKGDNRRDVIARVFKGVDNRMKSGYLLRDVINKVAGIHFTAADELHTLGALYESMLREMRDAAGDSGEFLYPARRGEIRLMVAVTNPRLGETVLDPASGTGGFLVEAYNHLSKQVKTVADRRVLQNQTLFGCEPKSLPYLLCQMNLLLHGLDSPQIDPLSALRFPQAHGDRRKGPRGRDPHQSAFRRRRGEGHPGQFPRGQTDLGNRFSYSLQLIMRKLRRQIGGNKGARRRMVVPNGTLFGDGVCARIKEELLKEFDLHTIVRLPNGVFAPLHQYPDKSPFL